MKGPKMGRTFTKRCLISLFYGEKFVDLRVADWHIQEISGFAICGLIIKNRAFEICGLANLRSLLIYDNGMPNELCNLRFFLLADKKICLPTEVQ
jgi:hypothetical protein